MAIEAMLGTAAAPSGSGVELMPTSMPRVLLVVEGSYPVSWGGVSTWCDTLVRGLPDIEFHLLAVVAQPGMPIVFELPPNVVETTIVPLWNVRDVAESEPDAGLRDLRARRSATSSDAVASTFAPALRGFLRGILSDDPDLDRIARDLHACHRFLKDRDLGTAMQHPAVWDVVVEEVERAYVASVDARDRRPLLLWEVTTAYQWICRWLFPIARPLPKTDVVHLAMAGAPSLVGVAAKLEHGAGLLLTEHGVFLRERYLAEAERRDSVFLKQLALGFARRVSELTYALADQVSPCCDYNQRWERVAGVSANVVETIYYGLDIDKYSPAPWPQHERPTVVWVGRINPLKDVETLLRAAALVAEQQPDVLFRLYGGAPAEDADYHRRCLELHAELGLEGVVEFAGYTNDPVAAFAESDVVVLSSVSEGFPFSILEAMLCGRPVVATAVGGIPEQILDTGIVVEPRDPEALADGLIQLTGDLARARRLGTAARERAASLFGTERFEGLHRASYLSLSPRHDEWTRSSVAPEIRVVEDDDDLEPVTALDDLLSDVRSRLWFPVDEFEVAALLESSGITDRESVERFGERDVFHLARGLLSHLRSRPSEEGAAPPAEVDVDDLDRPAEQLQASTEQEPEPSAPPLRRLRLDVARLPWLALLPTAALLTAIFGLAAAADMGQDQMLALVLGITAGMVCTVGVALAVVHRASSLLAVRKLSAVRRVLTVGVLLVVSVTLISTTLLSSARWRNLEFLHDQRATFVTTAVVLAVIWAVASWLSLVSASGWTGVALCVGVVVGGGVDLLLARVPGHVPLAIAAGVAATLAIMLRALRSGLLARIDGEPSADTTVPSRGFVVIEALPYVAYGTVAVLLFFAVHVVGGVSLGYTSPEMLALEFGLLLPLAPSVLALGTAERGIRSFWLTATVLQHELPLADRAVFSQQLMIVWRRNMRAYLTYVLVASIATIVVVVLAVRFGLLLPLVPSSEWTATAVVFTTALGAYAVYGWASLNGSYCLAFHEWRRPLVAATAGLVVTVVLAVVLVQVGGYEWLALALAAGSVVFGLGTRGQAAAVVAEADQRYATSV